MYTLLIVDDEENIRLLIKKYAEFEGYRVLEADDGSKCLDILKYEDVDLIIMDVMMPYIDGLTALKEIRKKETIPVIMLSANHEEYDKIHGYDLGADDYLEKPFSPKVLLRKIGVMLNRINQNEKIDSETYQFEQLEVNYTSRRVYVDGNEISLSLKEYDLLCLLIKNKNIVVERTTIMDKVWGYDFYGDERTLDVHIKNLRKNLSQYGKNIVTVRGVGYRFED